MSKSGYHAKVWPVIKNAGNLVASGQTANKNSQTGPASEKESSQCKSITKVKSRDVLVSVNILYFRISVSVLPILFKSVLVSDIIDTVLFKSIINNPGCRMVLGCHCCDLCDLMLFCLRLLEAA